MVKHLRHVTKTVKLLALLTLILFIWGAIWLQSAEHSLNFAKPWILSKLNPPDSQFRVDFGDLTIDWRRVTQLGKMRITRVTLAKDNNVIAQLPEVYATIDPIGFLPHRRTLHTITLNGARLYLTRNADNNYYVGLEGSSEPIAMKDLLASFTSGREVESNRPIRLPFTRLIMNDTNTRFHDDISGEDILSTDADLIIARKRGKYNASLTMPFTYNGGAGSLRADLTPNPDREDYLLNVNMQQFPGRLICTFAPCPENANLEGQLAAELRLGMLATGEIGAAWVKLTTGKAVLTAPTWFAKPVKLAASEVTVTHDATKNLVTAPSIKLKLEDTDIDASVTANKKEDGWYVDAAAKLTRPLEVTQLYKYWPIAMAPDTRDWVTSKLKAGRAETASMKLMLTPADMGDAPLSDKALSADVGTKDITIDYLPGFPNVMHVDGHVHFTGHTVKIETTTGDLLTGTKMGKMTLWAPDLNNPRIPMEVTMQAEVPVADAATFLQLKHFTFDDALMLDPKTATGSGSLSMKLKFDSDSGNKSTDPNEVHFDAVDYDITADLKNFAQKGIMGGYDVRALNGKLTANTKGMGFDGSLALGESGVSDIRMSQAASGPLLLDVKGRAGADGKPNPTANDFSLSYTSGEQSIVSLKGKQLDASVKYETGEKQGSILKDFPAIKLDIALEKLFLSPGNPLTDVKGNLNCTKQRCESASFSAMAGKSKVTGGIARNAANRRELKVTASDAGAFFKSLDITDRMTRGKFSLIGPYDDTKPGNPLAARLLVQDFTLKNSQILGRILSIGSLTGLANALTGSGIDFEKMSANITHNRGVVGVGDGKANGTAMGITVKGTVDMNTDKLKLKGVVVPAYALNSMVGKIPIVGNILAGPDGEGLIAFNYSVDGTFDKPDVGVNPLSGLTPGFLRGIFSGFEGPADGAAAPKEKDTGEFYPGEKKTRN